MITSLPIDLNDREDLVSVFRSVQKKLPKSYKRNIAIHIYNLSTPEGITKISLETCAKVKECFDVAISNRADQIPLLSKYRLGVVQLIFNRIKIGDPIPEKSFCQTLFLETTDKNHVSILIEKINVFKWKIATHQHFDIAKRFAPICPEILSDKINEFDTNRVERFKIAKIVIPLNRDAVVKNIDKYNLTIAQKVALGIEKPHEKIARIAPLKSLLLSISENGVEDGSDPLEVHGYRRTLFIYHLFLFCYNDNYRYLPGDTELQYGHGSNANDTKACHSALINNLRRMPRDSDEEDCTFSRRLDLFHAINSTIIHRTIVNEVDSAIEGKNRSPIKNEKIKLRPFAMEILNRVANADEPDYTPENGLEDFLAAADKVAKNIGTRLYGKEPEKKEILRKQMKGMQSILNADKKTIQGEFFKLQALISVGDPALKKTLKDHRWSQLSTETKDRIYQAQRDDILSHTLT